jgi:SLT domain-containing protein
LTALKLSLQAAFAPITLAISAMEKLLDLLGSWQKGKRSAPSFRGGGTGTDKDNNPATPFAMGGIVTRPTFAMIGEAGPEAVIPLNRAGGMGLGLTVNVQAGLVSSPDQIGQQIIEAIQSAQRRSGPVFAAA